MTATLWETFSPIDDPDEYMRSFVQPPEPRKLPEPQMAEVGTRDWVISQKFSAFMAPYEEAMADPGFRSWYDGSPIEQLVNQTQDPKTRIEKICALHQEFSSEVIDARPKNPQADQVIKIAPKAVPEGLTGTTDAMVVKASSKDERVQAKIVPGRAVFRDGNWRIEDARNYQPEEPLQLRIDPAAVKNAGSLGTKLALLVSLSAGGAGLMESVAAAAPPQKQPFKVALEAVANQASMPSVAANHEAPQGRQPDLVAELSPDARTMVTTAARVSKDPNMANKLALVNELYKSGVVFGTPEKAEVAKIAASRGIHLDFHKKADQLVAAAILMDTQHRFVKPVTGDDVINSVAAFRLGPNGVEQNQSRLQGMLKVLKGYEENLHGETAPAPHGTKPSHSESADPLPKVNAEYKQIILDAAANNHASPQLLAALFKTYNGSYTAAISYPRNTQEGWMGLSGRAARGIDRGNLSAAAERAAEMLKNTEKMPLGDKNQLKENTLLFEALAYRFGGPTIERYIERPGSLSNSLVKKISEYKSYDFRALSELQAEAAAAAHQSAQQAIQAPAERPAAPPQPESPKPASNLPPSATDQSKILSGKILSSPNITFDHTAPHNRVQKSIQTNERDGKTFTHDSDHTPNVTLSPQLQQDILVLADQGFKIKITSVTTGEHIAKSAHYAGCAIDIAPQSDSPEDFQKIIKFLYDNRVELKIDQLIYGGPLPDGVQLLNNGQPLPDAAAFYGKKTLDEHEDHAHISVLKDVASQPLPPTTTPGELPPASPPATGPTSPPEQTTPPAPAPSDPSSGPEQPTPPGTQASPSPSEASPSDSTAPSPDASPFASPTPPPSTSPDTAPPAPSPTPSPTPSAGPEGNAVAEIPTIPLENYGVQTQALSRADVTADELNAILANTDLAGTGQAFIDIQNQYGVNALYAVAHAAIESDWGKARIPKEHNNIFGINATDSNPEGAYDYSSYSACIEYWGKWLSKEYLTPGGDYYTGTSISSIFNHYSRDGQNEARKIVNVINRDLVPQIQKLRAANTPAPNPSPAPTPTPSPVQPPAPTETQAPAPSPSPSPAGPSTSAPSASASPSPAPSLPDASHASPAPTPDGGTNQSASSPSPSTPSAGSSSPEQSAPPQGGNGAAPQLQVPNTSVQVQ